MIRIAQNLPLCLEGTHSDSQGMMGTRVTVGNGKNIWQLYASGEEGKKEEAQSMSGTQNPGSFHRDLLYGTKEYKQ